MKKIYLLLFVTFAVKVSSQPIPKSWDYENIFNIASYIFEGEVIDTIYYNGNTGTNEGLVLEILPNGKFAHSFKPLTAHKIKITKILRGNIKPGTIELVIEGGEYWTNGIRAIDYCDECFRPLPIGVKLMFFCTEMSKKWKPSTMKTDNEIRLMPVEMVGFYIENFYEPGPDFKIIGHGFEAFGKIFSSKKEFYQYLSKYPDITIPKEYEQNDIEQNLEKKNNKEIEKKEK